MIVNKLAIVCDGDAPIYFNIGLDAANESGIQTILNTISALYGTYTYGYIDSGGGVYSVSLTIEGATCNPFLYVDGVPYSAALVGGNGAYIIGQGSVPYFNLEQSIESATFSIEPCCDNCNNPTFVTTLYEGDSYIPFSLDMVAGTIVKVDGTTDQSSINQGRGVIELSTPLVAGQSVRLKVEACGTYSESVVVKAIPEDCDTIPKVPCYISVLSIQVETVDLIYGKIKSLNVAAYGDLQYRIDSGAWVNSWTELGKFPLNTGVTLNIKSKANPACKITYPIIVVEKFS